MNRVGIPGGTYCEAFPNGVRAWVTAPTHLWMRGAPDGRRAWQDEPTGHIIESTPDGRLHDRGTSFGINPVIYAPNLVINTGQVTGQGFRFWDGSRIWTGDETVQGADLAEWTQLGDVRVGFSYKGARVLINGRVLYEGNAKAVRFNRDGDKLAIAFWSDVGSQFRWLDRSEVETLPREDEEPPVPEPTFDDTDLDRRILATLKQVRAKYPNPIQASLRETLGAILNETAWIRRQAGDPVWLEAKDDDNSALQPKTNRRIAKDIIQTVEGGIRCGRDYLDATGIGVAGPYLGRKGLAEDAKAVLPVDPGGVTPDPDPPPDGELADRVVALEADVANLKAWARGLAF